MLRLGCLVRVGPGPGWQGKRARSGSRRALPASARAPPSGARQQQIRAESTGFPRGTTSFPFGPAPVSHRDAPPNGSRILSPTYCVVRRSAGCEQISERSEPRLGTGRIVDITCARSDSKRTHRPRSSRLRGRLRAIGRPFAGSGGPVACETRVLSGQAEFEEERGADKSDDL